MGQGMGFRAASGRVLISPAIRRDEITNRLGRAQQLKLYQEAISYKK
ncbi:MAG TPA: hypothetical protein GXX51_01065 [Firmicutes bacterium]|nr:hypothetical protein [Bacillota bacterium]